MAGSKNSDFKFMMVNSLYTFAGQVSIGLIGIISAIAIARVYGPSGNGIFAMAMLLPSLLAMLLNLGMSASNVYLISSGSSHVREAILGNIILSIASSITGLVVGFLAIEFYADALFPGIPRKILWFALSIFPVILVNGFFTSIFHGLQRFAIFNKILLFEPLIFLLGILAIAPLQDGDLSILIGLKLISSAITLVLIILRCVRLWREADSIPTHPLEFIRKAANYGFKANLGPITQFLNYKIDIFILNFFTNVSVTGVYVVAVTLVEKLFLISGAISTILFPKLSQLSSDDFSKMELTAFVSRMVLLLTIIGALGLAVFAYFIIKYLFGSEFLGSLYPLIILIPGVVVISLAKIWANDIAARGKPEINMYISMITLIFNTLGNIIIIPRLGMSGAALTTTLSYLVSSGLTFKYYNNLTGNSMGSVFIPRWSDFERLIKILKK